MKVEFRGLSTMNARTSVVILLMSLLVACVQYQPIQPEPRDQKSPYDVSIGDTVKIVTDKAEGVEFRVTEISETAIVGNDIEVRFENIRTLQVKKGEVETKVIMATLSIPAIMITFAAILLVALL